MVLLLGQSSLYFSCNGRRIFQGRTNIIAFSSELVITSQRISRDKTVVGGFRIRGLRC